MVTSGMENVAHTDKSADFFNRSGVKLSLLCEDGAARLSVDSRKQSFWLSHRNCQQDVFYPRCQKLVFMTGQTVRRSAVQPF